MTTRIVMVVFLSLLFAIASTGTSRAYPDELGFPLRIGLFQIGVPREVLLEPGDDRVDIFDLNQRKAIFSGECRGITIRARGDELHLALSNGPRMVSRQRLAFIPAGKGPHFMKVGTGSKNLRAYRGSIEIVPFGGRILIVNLIPMEEYLRSVVPCEIGKDTADAALEAQAIAARTYAVRQLKRHASGGFYLCDGQHCQAYGGMRFESLRPSMAVAQTRGLVLTFEGSTANSVYHARCGGELKACDKVWGGAIHPYLPAHPDRFGNHAAFCSLPKQKKTWKATSSQRPEVSQYSPQGDRETDAAVWNSLLLWSEAKQAQSQARGHGVGMCQDGAVGMALLGFSRNHILGFYYPGTRLARLSASMLPPSERLAQDIVLAEGDRHAFLLKQPPITPPRVSSKSVVGKPVGIVATTVSKVSGKGKIAKSSVNEDSAQVTKVQGQVGFDRWFWSNRPPVNNPLLAAGKTLKTKKKSELKVAGKSKGKPPVKMIKGLKKTPDKKAGSFTKAAKETKTGNKGWKVSTEIKPKSGLKKGSETAKTKSNEKNRKGAVSKNPAIKKNSVSKSQKKETAAPPKTPQKADKTPSKATAEGQKS